MGSPPPRLFICPVNYENMSWRKAPELTQSSPIQPSTIGLYGAITFSAGCGSNSAIAAVKPSYEEPTMPTRPLDSGTFFTSQSMVSQASVAWSVSLSLSGPRSGRSEEHTSELQSLMRISYAVFCLKKKKKTTLKQK